VCVYICDVCSQTNDLQHAYHDIIITIIYVSILIHSPFPELYLRHITVIIVVIDYGLLLIVLVAVMSIEKNKKTKQHWRH